MLPRPRTLLLLLGAFILLLGFHGLLRQTIAALDPDLDSDGFILSGNAETFVSYLNGIRLLWIFLIFVFSTILAVASVAMTMRMLKWAGIVAALCGLVLLTPRTVGWLADTSREHWSIFLLIGFAVSLLVTLYNSEELTERWLGVVSKAALLMGTLTTILFVFFCYATHSKASRLAEEKRDQRLDDNRTATQLIDDYLKKPPSAPELERMIAVSESLLRSNREASLRMGRFCHKAILDYQASELSNQRAVVNGFAAVFPPPTISSNRKRWESVVAQLSGVSFEGSLERCLFSNEDLRNKIPYKTYINLIREERMSIPASDIKGKLNVGFKGDLAQFKQSLRALSIEKLNALPAHCEIYYLVPNDKNKAFALADKLREHFRVQPGLELMVPDPELVRLLPKSKDPGAQLAIFARGASSYEIRLKALLKFLSGNNFGYPRGQGVLPPSTEQEVVELIRTLTDMDYTQFMRYSSGSEETRQLREPSLKYSVFREMARLNVLTEYGDAEKHFEIWLVPSSGGSQPDS